MVGIISELFKLAVWWFTRANPEHEKRRKMQAAEDAIYKGDLVSFSRILSADVDRVSGQR